LIKLIDTFVFFVAFAFPYCIYHMCGELSFLCSVSSFGKNRSFITSSVTSCEAFLDAVEKTSPIILKNIFKTARKLHKDMAIIT